MYTPSSFWEEASRSWALPKLYQDLAIAKGRELTTLQKAKLRGALCSIQLKDVAEKLNVSINGLRTGLSCGLYRLIEALLWKRNVDHSGRIYWQQIPRLLSVAGYNVSKGSNISSSLATISTGGCPDNLPRAREIIEAIELGRLDEKIRKTQLELPSTVAQRLEQEGDAVAKEKDLSSAIHFYRTIIEKDPSRINVIIKIATCYSELGQYEDSVEIALEGLAQSSERNNSKQLNNLLGSAFYELALSTLDDLILSQALDYYQRASSRDKTKQNILGTWKRFDLLVQFSYLKQENSDHYIRKAKLAFYTLKELVQVPATSIHRQQHQQEILEGAKRLRHKVTDSWLCQALDDLPNQLSLQTHTTF